MAGRPRVGMRIPAVLEGRRLARSAATALGKTIQQARVRRHWTQKQLGERVGLRETRVGQIERGHGSGVPPETWFSFAVALKLPMKLEFGRDAREDPADAGHLKIQELALRLARTLGITRFFELPTKPSEPSLSVDVGWRDDARRVLILNECWNTFGNINASVRSTHRKVAEAEQLAAAASRDGNSYRVACCWIVRDTRRNRELVARYPEVFATAFPGSSTAWVRALSSPKAPVPEQPGFVWCDLQATRVFARRNRDS
jgi:transcriptional regulator with XRE-family HTH domain